MKAKSTLKKFLSNVQNKGIQIFISKKIEQLEQIISLECAEDNIQKVNEYISTLKSESGGFSQQGLWKLKSRLCPRPTDPPTAKLDNSGKLVTNPDKLLNLYLEKYVERLSHKKMKAEYDDIFILKNQLWKLRLEQCSEVKLKNGHLEI